VLSISQVHADSSEELFKKVFGKTQEAKHVNLDATLGDFYLGSLGAIISGDKLISLSGKDVEALLKNKVRENKRAAYDFGDREVDIAKLPFKITYLAAELRLKIELPAEDQEPLTANIYDELIPYYARKAETPATFSFGTNYKVEAVDTTNFGQPDSVNAQVDSFMNIKSLTFENQMNYLSTKKVQWYRQNSRLTIDSPSRMQRFEAGDVSYPILGYQQSRQIGGVSLYKDFSLNPYRVTAPTSSFEYEIISRSLVRTIVNGAVLKTEYKNPGHYSVKDIPLNNGLNRVVVEVTDDFGKKSILVFNEASSLDSLAPKVSRYSLVAGVPSNDTDVRREYDQTKGTFYSAFYQYGMNQHWSLGGYAQGNKNFNMLGASNIFSTAFGNWSLDFAGSKNKLVSGEAAQANYQLNLFGSQWYDSHTFNARIEYRSLWFNEAGEQFLNRFDYIGTASYSVPFLERFNVSLGGNISHPRIGDINKIGFDTSVTSRIFNGSSLTAFYGRTRDENKLWSTQLYVFLNISFGESASFASAFYEKSSETKRITLINDNGQKLNNLKTSATIDENISSRNGSLDLQYNTTLADLGVREEVQSLKGKTSGTRTSFRLLSAFAFVHDKDESAFSISRPISNSFVIFKPKENWKGQKFGVQSITNNNDTETGLFGESLVSGLSPYQYRRLLLDPSYLQPGYSLGQQSFVVFPRYRSGHLFVIGESGLLVLRGNMFDKNGNTLSLKVGYLTSQNGKTLPFFTGRDGEFLIEGAEPGIIKIQVDDDQLETKEINLTGKASGILDIGKVIVPNKEGRL
jgi:outer membrane usher protein